MPMNWIGQAPLLLPVKETKNLEEGGKTKKKPNRRNASSRSLQLSTAFGVQTDGKWREKKRGAPDRELTTHGARGQRIDRSCHAAMIFLTCSICLK